MTPGFPRRLGYRFLRALPPAPWWGPLRDRELGNRERPEVVAYGGGTSLSVLLSGIPSGRRDVVGTPIRYLVVVDDLREGETDTLLARRLVLAGLRDEDRLAFGRALDAAFDEATVDAMLSGTRDTAPVGDVVAEVLAKSWGAGDAGQPAGGPPMPAADAGGSWAGPADRGPAPRAGGPAARPCRPLTRAAHGQARPTGSRPAATFSPVWPRWPAAVTGSPSPATASPPRRASRPPSPNC